MKVSIQFFRTLNLNHLTTSARVGARTLPSILLPATTAPMANELHPERMEVADCNLFLIGLNYAEFPRQANTIQGRDHFLPLGRSLRSSEKM